MHNDVLAQVLSLPNKPTLADDVAERVRNAILSGQLAPEARISEAMLSELMGVSRGPVREALGRLEREGLVIVGRTGRTSVARLSRDDLDEVFSLRRALERLAIEYACLRATPEDIDDLQAVVDTMTATIARGINEKEAAELDLRFHDAIYRASRHRRLLNYLDHAAVTGLRDHARTERRQRRFQRRRCWRTPGYLGCDQSSRQRAGASLDRATHGGRV